MYLQIFKEAIKAAFLYKQDSTDFLDLVMKELEVFHDMIEATQNAISKPCGFIQITAALVEMPPVLPLKQWFFS